jgi:polar amino acid transport system substrate-binding protein
MKASLLTAAALVAAMMAPGAQAGETLDRVMKNHKLVMSTDPEYPPQSSLNADNQFEGFDIDVGKEIAKRLGVDIEFVTPGWDVITAGNWGGRWDMSVGSMTPTKKRAEVLNFPAIYYYTPASLAVHKDNKTITKPEDVDGKAIGVGVATTYENYLKHNLEIDAKGAPTFEYKIQNADIHTYDTDSLALDDLRLGDGVRLDAVITALPTILEAQKNGYPIKIVGKPLFMEPLSVATDKGDPEFDKKIADAVEEMHKDGTLSKLSEKWYGADLTSASAGS